jgi:quinol monooxygenase YgiN
MQLCLHTTYTVHPGTEAKFLELVVPLRQNAASEPKCQYYNAFISGEEETSIIRLVEIWDSRPDYLQYVCCVSLNLCLV